MKVRINDLRCVGHGMCCLAAPELFQLSDEDGHAYVLLQKVPNELDEAVLHAQRGCPEQAILVDWAA